VRNGLPIAVRFPDPAQDAFSRLSAHSMPSSQSSRKVGPSGPGWLAAGPPLTEHREAPKDLLRKESGHLLRPPEESRVRGRGGQKTQHGIRGPSGDALDGLTP